MGSQRRCCLVPLVSAAAVALLVSLAQAQIPVTCTWPCPDTSKCTIYLGAPLCMCPTGQRLINNKCSKATLAHSDWLDQMNNARAAVGSAALKWNALLAAEAVKIAADLGNSTQCKLIHDLGNYKGQGQTLAGGAQNIDPRTTNTDVVNKWVMEAKFYNYTRFDKNSKSRGCLTGKWAQCGHYLQIIWSTTKEVGCANSQCLWGAKKGRVWVCMFNPGGNIYGAFPYPMNSCFYANCPNTSTCAATTGKAVCVCPKGQAVVNGVCAADPCLGKTCPGTQVCDPSRGTPNCTCAEGWVADSPGSTNCISPACLGVACPAGSVCAANSRFGGTPYCACPAGQVFQNNACTSKPTKPLITTSLALRSAASPPAPLVIQWFKHKQCYNLADNFTVGSYRIIWNLNSTLGPTYPPGTVTEPCAVVFFWDQKNCRTKSTGFQPKNGDISKTAAGGFAIAKSISCV